MTWNGITDIAAIVTTPKSEYERLVRESERLRIVERMCAESKAIIPVAILEQVLDITHDDKESEG